jgi:hypothetical protein
MSRAGLYDCDIGDVQAGLDDCVFQYWPYHCAVLAGLDHWDVQAGLDRRAVQAGLDNYDIGDIGASVWIEFFFCLVLHRVSCETRFTSKEPKLVSILSETVVSRNIETASFGIFVETKLTTYVAKQLK